MRSGFRRCVRFHLWQRQADMSIMPKAGDRLYEPLADINVTPLVDVMLVLLIVFMITAPMLAAGMRVDLPRAKASQPFDARDPVIITVLKDGSIYLGRRLVPRA